MQLEARTVEAKCRDTSARRRKYGYRNPLKCKVSDSVSEPVHFRFYYGCCMLVFVFEVDVAKLCARFATGFQCSQVNDRVT